MLIPLATVLGGSEPGHLDGYGPITAELARRIAKDDVSFRRLVFDPLSGRPLDLGTSTYEVSGEMRRWIGARDRTCTFPGCRQRAAFCDADHAEEFPGGPTSCANCGLVCRRHHNFKTSKAWDLTRNPDDSVDWVSPHGLKWQREASTYEEFGDDEGRVENGSRAEEVVADDPDPPGADDPLPAPPSPDGDDDIDHDELNRLWWTAARAS